MSKRIGALQVQPCVDPNSKEYRRHRFVQWGDDERYQRCARCGTITAEGISSEARYPRVKQPERPIRHHHTFEPSRLDVRYEVCHCGATRAQKHPAPTVDVVDVVDVVDAPIAVVHCRKDAFDIYIGRPMARYPELKAEGWGNPFKPAPGVEDAIAQYREWVLQQPHLLARLPELRGKVLGCWCAPKGGVGGDLYGHICHGEVLAWLADHPEDVRLGVGGGAA